MRNTTLNPITFEVMRSSFEYAVERMGTVLQRAAFSPIIYDMVDYTNGIFDPDCNLIGQKANCPVHIAAMHYSAEASLNKYKDDVHEGDVIALNDPYQGGTHIPDITFTAPIYFEGEVIAYGVCRANWTDFGGGGPGGQAFTDHIAAEGLRLPPLKLVDRGVLNQDLVDIIRNNTRTPHYVDGDIQAMRGALKAAEIEMTRLAKRYGADTLRQAMRELLDYTERITREAISRIPDGEYEADDWADTDGFRDEPYRVHVKVTVDGDQITTDFTGTDPQATGAINSPEANTMSAIYYALKFFLGPDAPANAGLYRCIDVVLPVGTWLNPRWPAPVVACTTLASSKTCAAIWQALAQAIPDEITACTFGECNWFMASMEHPQTREISVLPDEPAGGWGGTPYADGINVTMDPLGNCMNLSAEVAELLFPVEYESFEFRDDSGGPGKFRGGLGARYKIRLHGRTILSMECSRTTEGAPGANGGLRGSPQRQSRVSEQGVRETVGGWTEDGRWEEDGWANSGDWKPCLLARTPFQPGETFLFESGGGGGWGSPLERDPESVLQDVLDDYVTPDTARIVYGVVLDRDAEKVDEAATLALRKQMARA